MCAGERTIDRVQHSVLKVSTILRRGLRVENNARGRLGRRVVESDNGSGGMLYAGRASLRQASAACEGWEDGGN